MATGDAGVKRVPVLPLAAALKRVHGVGNLRAEEVQTAITHLRGKVVRVKDGRRERWTLVDVLAVETVIEFGLALAGAGDDNNELGI